MSSILTDKVRVKIPYTKFVHPINRTEFSIHVITCLFFQFILSSVVIIVLNMKIFSIEWAYEHMGNLCAAWIVNLLMLCFVYDLNKFRARFKDIYPDLELNKIFYFLAGFVPLFFFVMVVFLCVKKSESGNTYPRAFKFRYAIPAFVVMLSLQATFSGINFYTASPTSYHLVEMVKGTITAEKYQAKPDSKNIFADYQNEVSSDLQTSEVLILLSKVTADYRSIASETGGYRNSYAFGGRFLHACHRAIEFSEDNELKFSDFSPLHWIHPGGPVEILMTKTMTQNMSERAAAQLYDKCFGILERLENHLEYNHVAEKTQYQKELSELRMKFSSTKSFAQLKR